MVVEIHPVWDNRSMGLVVVAQVLKLIVGFKVIVIILLHVHTVWMLWCVWSKCIA